MALVLFRRIKTTRIMTISKSKPPPAAAPIMIGRLLPEASDAWAVVSNVECVVVVVEAAHNPEAQTPVEPLSVQACPSTYWLPAKQEAP